MTAKITIIVLSAILLISCLFILTSCKTEKYKVICSEGVFSNVKKGYKAGEKVKVYFGMIATDTDYTFYLDGKRISSSGYSDLKGYSIEFIMPDHNVELTYESKNSMEYVPASIDLPEGSEIFTYTETTHTPESNTSFKLSVTYVSDTEHSMSVTKEDGSTELYTIPRFPYESICSYNDINDLSEWNELEEYISLDGKSIELSFYYYGKYIKLSSDRMPEDGEGILKYLVSHFTDYMTQEYRNK